MTTAHRFPRLVFAAAGLYGLLTVTPLYWMEASIARDAPPGITHPEYYYGFLGAALVFQFVFLLIARDPMRLRPVMVATILEKLAWGVVVTVLVLQGRTRGPVVVFAAIDVLWAPLFAWAYVRTPKA